MNEHGDPIGDMLAEMRRERLARRRFPALAKIALAVGFLVMLVALWVFVVGADNGSLWAIPALIVFVVGGYIADRRGLWPS